MRLASSQAPAFCAACRGPTSPRSLRRSRLQPVPSPRRRLRADWPGGLGGATPNITVQTSGDAVVLVDSGPGDANERTIAAIRRISPKPIRFIINTQADIDTREAMRGWRDPAAPMAAVQPARDSCWPTNPRERRSSPTRMC